MPRQASVTVQNNFSKGLITEVTGLNFPENACKETFDCVFDKTGEVTRRPGLQFEENFVVSASDISQAAVAEYLWQGVSKNGEVTFVVLQIGNIISFYRATSDQVISGAIEPFSIDISDYVVAGAPATQGIPCSFTSGNGLLFIAHPYCTPIYVSFDEELEDIDVTPINIKIRDVKGVDNKDSSGNILDVDHRPTPAELSNAITYNLLNQGWYAISACSGENKGFNIQNVLAFFYNQITRQTPSPGNLYPSESEIWWVYKAPQTPEVDENGNVVGEGSPTQAFSRLEFISQEDRFGSAQAPKGHYLLDAFNIDRSTVSSGDVGPVNSAYYSGTAVSTAGIPVESAGYQRPSQIAFFAGRVFYAGVNSTGFNTRIYFSQILEGAKGVDKAYQQEDPTSEQASDLLPTDGGIIEIPDVAKVVKLFTIGNSLYVFATNGIWAVSGSQGVGFTATDYSVVKVSSTVAISPTSFVEVEGNPIWWNTDGIWTLQQGSNSVGIPTVASLTNLTIQDFFDDIPNVSKYYAKGCYNPFTKVVQWLYRSTDEPVPDAGTDGDVQEHYKYDRILNLDMTTGAFYPWTIPVTCLQISGLVCLQGNAVDSATRNVTVDGVQVVVGANDIVVTETLRSVITSSVFKYITLNTCDILTSGGTDSGITFNSGFKDSLDQTFDADTTTRDMQTVCIGDDGKTYVVANVSATNDEFVQFDGTNATAYTLTEADIRTDIEGQVGVLSGSWDNGHKIIPFPYSPYFYVFVTKTQVGANMFGFFALYKINGSGTLEFQGVRAYDTNFSYMLITVHGVGYQGMGANPLSHELLVAISRHWSADSGFSNVLSLPSVTDLIANTNDIGTPTNDETSFIAQLNSNVGEAVETWGFFNRASTVSGLGSGTAGDIGVFFLPVLSGGVWTNTVNLYINKAVIDYYIANPTLQTGVGWSSTLNTFVAANSTSTGFVLTKPLTGTNAWTVNTNLGPPFADEHQERDGSTSSNRTSYLTPSLKYDSTNDLYLLTWTKRFNNTTANLTPTGAYNKVVVLLYNPETQVASTVDSEAGNTYDIVADLGFLEAARYDYHPKDVFVFWNAASSILYLYLMNFGFANDDRTVITQFGTFLKPSVGTANVLFSEFNNETDWVDWAGDDHETDYTSYFITGDKLRGEAIRKFQNNYIRFYSRGEDTVFDFYGRWDFANLGSTGRWGQVQRITLDTADVDYNTRRLKIRGNGLALNLKVSSVSGSPFNIIGWSNLETGNSAP